MWGALQAAAGLLPAVRATRTRFSLGRASPGKLCNHEVACDQDAIPPCIAATIECRMKIALGQINTTVGDLSGNVNLMVGAAHRASGLGADWIAFPELSVTGYPPRDLVEKESFLERSECELQRLARETAALPIALICGYVGKGPDGAGKRATNSAAILQRGQIVFRQIKTLLPTYDVFDEARYFLPGDSPQLASLSGRSLALTICEDAWNDKQYWERRL